MCGIAGYKGKKQASPLLYNALKMLEYRGYDSAGIAILNEGAIEIKKGVGKVDQVKDSVGFEMEGSIGIAHTRWATTGAVTKENAHPHFSSDKRFAVVQNGIVENYQDLKADLDYEFVSDTDTEVIAHMIEEELKKSEILQAVQSTFLKLHGRNTFVVLDSETETIIAVRKGSPLVLGIGNEELFLSSDTATLLEHTKEVIFIDDNELVVINDGFKIYNAKTLQRVDKDISTVEWTVEQAQKGNFEHFMIKEIMEQKITIEQAVAQDKIKVEEIAHEINNAFGTYAVGCGTAGKIALASTYVFAEVAKRHINFVSGSEFPCYHNFLTDKSLLIAISQSGETADTLEAINVAKKIGGKVTGIVNVMGSTLMRKADYTLLVNAGPETSVCSTKATTGQLAIMYLLAYACDNRYDEGVEKLKETAKAVDNMLNDDFLAHIKKLAEKIVEQDNMCVIGRGVNYPMALESAIKIQEVSYLHAEGFAGGELKHGPIALISEGTPCIALIANDETKEDTLTNAIEVKTRGGYIVGIAPENNEAFDYWIQVPDLPETSPIANIIPVQILAYYLAVLRGNDVDQPRNLAKECNCEMIRFDRIKLLIVDMDNTFCDTFNTLSKPQWGKVEKALKKRGLKKYATLLKKNFGKHSFKYTLEHSGMDEKDIKFAMKIYDDVDVTQLKLFPDANHVLHLKMKKILLSRGDPALQKKKIKHLDVRKRFDDVVIVDTFHTKTAAIKRIVKKYKVKPKEVLIIGDRIEEEIADGKRLGIPTVLVKRPGWPVTKSRFKPDLTVKSLETVCKKIGHCK